MGEHGEIIANIPIRVSARAVFSKFNVFPHGGVNFGALIVNARNKQCTFTLENRGEFEFKYAIVKKPTAEQMKKQSHKVQAKGNVKSSQDASENSSITKMGPGEGGRSIKGRQEPTIRTDVVAGSQKLVLGMFTIYPAMGTILCGQGTVVNVDCSADKPGKQEALLVIEISDRFKADPPVVYRIFAEVFEPVIDTTDIISIFEEHGVCPNLCTLKSQLCRKDCVGTYVEAEQRFVFDNVIVGQAAKARFKITNPCKVPCDAKFAIVSASGKHKVTTDVFEVEKSKSTIASHSYTYAMVTFKPMAIQSYSAIFEAYPEGYKQKALTFEVQGEGNLPQVEIVEPTLRNARGQPLLLFRRILTTQTQTMRVTLRNTGTISTTAYIHIRAGKSHFSVASPNETTSSKKKAASASHKKRPLLLARLQLCLEVGDTKDFLVTFHPTDSEKYQGELSLKIQDNQFETIVIQLVGEGYKDDVSVENIHGSGKEWNAAQEDEEFQKLLPEQVEGKFDFSKLMIKRCTTLWLFCYM